METRKSTTKETEQKNVNNTAMEPRISRETLKLRMAYALYDFWGLRIPTGSKALYDGLNARDWFWYPNRLHWAQPRKKASEEKQDDSRAEHTEHSITV